MDIIVTGGTGFLGRHLLRALSQAGHKVKNIDLRDNPEFDTVIADVRDNQAMLEHIRDADLVFHLASLIEAGDSVENPQKYVDYNISGTLSVLEAMRQNNIKTFLFSSSAAIYGEPKSIPIREDDPTMPISPYGVTKLAMEGLLSSYVAAHRFTGVALRYFNLYGPEEHHEPESHALPRFIKQIYNNEEVTVWGSGEHQRDYVYIDDIVSAHLKALTYAVKNPQEYHYFNLSTEKPSTVLDIVKAVESTLHKEANIRHHADRPGDPLILYASAQKAHDHLGWTAQVSLEEGVKRTVAYFVEVWSKNND
jgi:UDP-glucose 4-epimerase